MKKFKKLSKKVCKQLSDYAESDGGWYELFFDHGVDDIDIKDTYLEHLISTLYPRITKINKLWAKIERKARK